MILNLTLILTTTFALTRPAQGASEHLEVRVMRSPIPLNVESVYARLELSDQQVSGVAQRTSGEVFVSDAVALSLGYSTMFTSQGDLFLKSLELGSKWYFWSPGRPLHLKRGRSSMKSRSVYTYYTSLAYQMSDMNLDETVTSMTGPLASLGMKLYGQADWARRYDLFANAAVSFGWLRQSLSESRLVQQQVSLGVGMHL